ncbi:hypothetical protein LJC49_10050 [Ruminococcaceae bacterium OttesenSCG-928-I18]|nr:hypothetical protein [Ruminococcaceae bacterium OttesenSCG-928-I18]
MKTVKKKELTDLLSEGKLNQELLYACLRKLENMINTAAYNYGKEKYTTQSKQQLEYSLEYRNSLVYHRNDVWNLMKEHYNFVVPKIKDVVAKMDKRADALGEKEVERLFELIDDGSYEFAD